MLVTGATGSGKSYLAGGLGHQACRHGLSARYYRLSRLLGDLKLARPDGSHPKLLRRLACTRLLMIDDWGLALWMIPAATTCSKSSTTGTPAAPCQC